MVTTLLKSTLREIRASLGRFLAILTIVGLGVGFLSGLRMCQPAMLATGTKYLDTYQFHDFRLLSTLGFTAEDVDEICRMVEALEYMDETIFISFKLNNLILVKERNPQQAAQYLVENPIDDDFIQEMADKGLGIDARQDLFTEEILQKCRAKGVQTNAWTVNKPDMARKLMDWGIDFITTNILE